MIRKRIPRILLVDNEPQWIQAVKPVLERHGKYTVEGVTDVRTALDYSYANGFDLILINADLAFGEYALEFEQMVRLYPEKILVVSDVGSISTAIRVFKMGADYAEKPFEPRRVVELVTSRLQQAYGAVD